MGQKVPRDTRFDANEHLESNFEASDDIRAYLPSKYYYPDIYCKMTLRLKLFQKIAQVAEEVPTEPLNVPAEPQTPVSQPAKPDPMAAWKALLNGVPDISIHMESLITNLKKYPDVDWAEIARDIEASKNIEAAQIFVAMLPQVDPTLVQRMHPQEEETEIQLVERFTKLMTGRPSLRTKLIPELVAMYGESMQDWGWLVVLLLQERDFPNLTLLCKLIPNRIDWHTIAVVMEYRSTVQEKFDFIREVPLAPENLSILLKRIVGHKDGWEATPEDLEKVYITQSNDRGLYELAINRFVATENPEFLKILIMHNPVSGYGFVLRRIMSAYDPPHIPLIETALNVLGPVLPATALKKTIEVTFTMDSAFDAQLCLLNFAKGKLDRGDLVLKYLKNMERGNFYKILDLFDADEITYIINNFLDSEDYYSNQCIELFSHPRVNKTLLIGKVIQKESYTMALELLQSAEVSKNDLDVLLLQKFIEGSGDPSLIKRMLNDLEARNKKVNFAAGKKKYNDTIKKTRLSKPEDEEEFVEMLASNVNADRIPERLSFIQEAAAKKDWFYLDENVVNSLFGLPIFEFFLRIKNKHGKDLYHEIKGDNILVIKCRAVRDNMDGFRREWREIVTDDFGTQMVNASTNFGQFVKLLEKSVQAADLKHQFGINDDISRLVILNNKIDLGDPSIKEFLELYKGLENLDEARLNTQIEEIIKTNPALIDKAAFDHNFQVFKLLKSNFESGQSISLRKGSAEYEAFKNLHSQVAMIKQFQTIRQYIEEAQPKVPELNLFNWTHPNGLEFSVLKYLDPYAFKVGADTECCQRIGGAGAEAAIDSFINPLAGVLVLKNQGLIISQSYFHFVPKDKGLILDNVEWNSTNADRFGINELLLSKVYADFAAGIKADHPEIAYVLCGKAYNKIDNLMFQENKLEEDPRSFSVNEDDPYTDFDEDDHLDLLNPKADLHHISTDIKKERTAERTVNLISLATVRRMYLQRSAEL